MPSIPLLVPEYLESLPAPNTLLTPPTPPDAPSGPWNPQMLTYATYTLLAMKTYTPCQPPNTYANAFNFISLLVVDCCDFCFISDLV